MKRYALTLSFLAAACAAGPNNLKPGPDFPDDLALPTYFTDDALGLGAKVLVNQYAPQEGDREKSVVYAGSAQDIVNAFVRSGVYETQNAWGDSQRLAITKQALFTAVAIAAKFPNAAQYYYDLKVDRVLDDMVDYARTRKPESEWDTRKPLTDEQIAEMFVLYADVLDQMIPYFRLALKEMPQEAQADWTLLNTPDPSGDAERQLFWTQQSAASARLPETLRNSSGLVFDYPDFETWKLAMRRKAQGGNDIVKVMIDLTVQASARARSRAAQLHKPV